MSAAPGSWLPSAPRVLAPCPGRKPVAHTPKVKALGRQGADQWPRSEYPDQYGPLRLLLTTQLDTKPQAGPGLP